MSDRFFAWATPKYRYFAETLAELGGIVWFWLLFCLLLIPCVLTELARILRANRPDEPEEVRR